MPTNWTLSFGGGVCGLFVSPAWGKEYDFGRAPGWSVLAGRLTHSESARKANNNAHILKPLTLRAFFFLE